MANNLTKSALVSLLFIFYLSFSTLVAARPHRAGGFLQRRHYHNAPAFDEVVETDYVTTYTTVNEPYPAETVSFGAPPAAPPATTSAAAAVVNSPPVAGTSPTKQWGGHHGGRPHTTSSTIVPPPQPPISSPQSVAPPPPPTSPTTLQTSTTTFANTQQSSSTTIAAPPATSSQVTGGSSVYPAQSYSLLKAYTPGNFFSEFTFFTGADPTNGFVTYVDQATAQSAGLISETNGQAIIASDSTNVAPNGRQSVRLQSTDSYTEVLILADFAHLPEAACGQWPAFWTSNLNNWPSGGEIDIIEGVNLDTANHVALHTTDGCVVTSNGQTSTFDTTNCYVDAPGQSTNAGCGGYSAETTSYGDSFNSQGGGIYAMDWRSTGIRVWTFPRSNIPADILAGNPTTANWPLPDFDFGGSQANIPSHFNQHQIIFDLTFCGDWAGAVYSTSGCSGSCTDFVANNPSAFANAYFAVNNLTVWQAS